MNNTVTEQQVNDLMEAADIKVITLFDKCTVVAARLSNGFVIVESSAAVSPENYSEEMGREICLERIKNKIWELEGYKLQCTL